MYCDLHNNITRFKEDDPQCSYTLRNSGCVATNGSSVASAS